VSPLRSPDHPLKTILREPLVKPNKDERERYFPNFVYSCGSLLRGGQLITPYRMSDYATTFATAPLDEVLAALQ
jgi:predicted GH43/DUF377 family glycosyl hydrolase